ncbi:UDP-glucuronosyltransferase 1-6-like [Rhopilema esculentum]|uniref:UDP-glucuronosyltransferase 1-6-like n=1 Tax=Rhopilema esculentum TaxID=499914 RepID=UPI0031D95DF5|eukprot:gene101-9717_t
MVYKSKRVSTDVCRILILTSIVVPLLGDKILLVPFPWPSHYKLLETIGEELKKRNHDVVMVIPSTETYRNNSHLKTVDYKVPKIGNNTFVRIAEKRLETAAGFGVNWLVEYVTLLEKIGRALMEENAVMKIAQEADIIISDTAFLVAPIFADYHKLPLVFVSPFGHLPGCMADTFGNIENPALVPTFVATALFEGIGLPQRMNFLQRSFNFMSNIISKILRDLITLPILRPLTKRYSSKTLLQLWSEVPLVLIPMDYSLEYPRPDLPHVKMIGPLSPKENSSPLPDPFRNIVKEAQNGIIIVSFGITNNLHSRDTLRILESLMALKYSIVWKYNTTKVENMIHEYGSKKHRIQKNKAFCENGLQECRSCNNDSQRSNRNMNCSITCTLTPCKSPSFLKVGDNVYIYDWIPQQHLLQHKKTKLFVTHCGLNSLYEALYHNTQVLCVPLFGEQFDSAGRVVSRNIGKAMRLKDLNTETLQDAVYDLTHNRVYIENVKKIALRLRRSKVSPAEKAAYWIEYVLAENGDMGFLKPPDIPYYQFLLLDIILFWGMAIVLSAWLLFKIQHARYKKPLM